MSSRKDRIALYESNGVTVLDMGQVEIWDGADLSLLRDTLTELIEQEGCRSVGVQMRAVKYIPSGFFGMLYDWHDQGVEIYLYSPQPNVARMLWFRKFFDHLCDGCYVLLSEPKPEVVPGATWSGASPGNGNGNRSHGAPAYHKPVL